MPPLNKKKHWETIYQTKKLNEVSWFQPKPTTSLELLSGLSLPAHSKIIDVGGGDSFLADNLIALGYQNITVLDISEAAINRAKKRLGSEAKKVQWIVKDIIDFNTTEKYDLWHDRAAFHFLTNKTDIETYIKATRENIAENGVLILGTFSKLGPTKCSGIDIKQYSETRLSKIFSPYFKKLSCFTVNHKTPFNTLQNFVFCSFKKKLV